MRKFLTSVAVVALCAAATVAGGNAARIRVAATTSHIGAIVAELGREKVEVITLVPGAMCPGHFDIEPGTMKKIAGADLFLRHDWEKWTDGLFGPSAGKRCPTKTVAVQGSWMLPEPNARAAGAVTALLIECDPRNRTYYERNLRDYERKIGALSATLRKKAQRFSGIGVICSEQQKDFLSSLGCTIVATYGRGEDLTVRGMADIMEAAGKAKVALVVDNLQSGAAAGAEMARALHAGHVTLSNFPVDGTYAQTLERNLLTLEEALDERDHTDR